jgi:hypothetical protein
LLTSLPKNCDEQPYGSRIPTGSQMAAAISRILQRRIRPHGRGRKIRAHARPEQGASGHSIAIVIGTRIAHPDDAEAAALLLEDLAR